MQKEGNGGERSESRVVDGGMSVRNCKKKREWRGRMRRGSRKRRRRGRREVNER